LQGHAIEARLYAEDPAAGFLPRSGDVLAWRPPAGVRVDHGLNPVDSVSPFYDPMLAKLIVHAPTRDEARHRLIAALHETVVLGLPTNRRFLIDLLEHPLFADGRATTDAIGGVIQPSTLAIQPGTTERAILAALLLEASGEVPTGALAGWSSTGAMRAPVRLDLGEGIAAVDLEVHIAPARRFVVHEGAIRTTVVLAAGAGSDETTATVEGHSRRCVHAQAGGRIHVWIDGAEFAVADLIRRPRVRSEASGASDLRAPMNGRIVRLAAKPGDPVRKGQAIVVLEAMKMQHEITAPRDGVLASIPVGEGQQVATRALLAELVPV
jgi:geranyl-CoA carboxylase alpha subunit